MVNENVSISRRNSNGTLCVVSARSNFHFSSSVRTRYRNRHLKLSPIYLKLNYYRFPHNQSCMLTLSVTFLNSHSSSNLLPHFRQLNLKEVRRGHNDWQKHIVKADMDSYGSSDSNTDAFLESSAKMLPENSKR